MNCEGIGAELCFVLMTYAYAHCLRGSEIISSILPETEMSEMQYNKVRLICMGLIASTVHNNYVQIGCGHA
jgi:hypothetical protein